MANPFKHLIMATAIVLVGASASAQIILGPDAWYDIDGDGNIELLNGDSWYRTDTDGKLQSIKTITNSFGNIKILRFSKEQPFILISSNSFGVFAIGDDFSVSSTGLPRTYSKDYNYQYYPADFLGDGSIGLISRISKDGAEFENGYISTSNHSFIKDRLSIITWDEYNNIHRNTTLTSGGGLPSVANGMFVGGSSIKTSHYDNFGMLDLNGDGIIDLFDSSSGRYYLNTGQGSLVQNTFGGKVTVRDFNNDGIADIIVYNDKTLILKIVMSDGAGGSDEIELLNGYHCSDNIWCYDFDNDGDIDILVPLNKTQDRYDNGGSFLIFYENDGKGKFKKKENYIDGNLTFFGCLDFDADGKYEIIGLKYPNAKNKYNLCFYEISGKNIEDNPEIFFRVNSTTSSWPTDMFTACPDNSGCMSIFMDIKNRNEFSKVYVNSERNQRPSSPDKPQILFNPEDETLRVFWQAATDAETPSADLTYEVRVGTAPDLDDVVVTNSLPDGRRRCFAEGNNGHQLYRTFNTSSWPAGKYYISVQAIDPNIMGSPFSEVTIFEKKMPASHFSIEAADFPSCNDDVILRLTSNDKSVKNVEWHLSNGGDIIKSNSDKTECSIQFRTPGKQQISVAVTGNNGIALSKTREIDILNARVDTIDYFNLFYCIVNTFDLDADGSEECLNHTANHKIIEQDQNGKASQVKKMYNSNLPLSTNGIHKIVSFDSNRDGLVDFLSYKNYQNYVLWSNNGDKDLEFTENLPFSASVDDYGEDFFADFNNDGKLEILRKDGSAFIFLSDDCMSYEIVDNSGESFTPLAINDYDGDGLIDILVKVYRNSQDYYYILYNKGNLVFNADKALSKYQNINPTMIADIDNDGKPDIFYNDYRPIANAEGNVPGKKSVAICFGNGHTIEIPALEGMGFKETIGIFDFDNNGFKDIALETDIVGCIIYLNPDYSYNIIPLSSSSLDEDYPTHFHNNAGYTIAYNGQIHGTTNERPTAPKDIRHTVDNNFVNIAWSAASDKETPSTGLKYNISIKKKGIDGEGAYLLSPLNLGKDNVSVPSDHHLLNSSKISIPLSSIPAGEYEVKVQAADGQYVTGPFSEVYSLSVPEVASLESPTSAIVGQKIAMRILGNIESPKFDFGSDSEIAANSNHTLFVTWNAPGMKILKINGEVVGSVMVYDAPEAEFTLPVDVLYGSTINVACPTAKSGYWGITSGGETYLLGESPIISDFELFDYKIAITVSGTKDFTLRHTVTEEYGSTTVEHSCKINAEVTSPEIDFVAIDESGTHYEINWSAATIPSGVEIINIYRETDRLNQFTLIGSVAINEGKFIDMASLPNVKAERYAISAVLPYGESRKSETHQTMHLQINKGWNNSINLMWRKYEGRQVASYQIYEGNSVNDLKLVDTVNGNLSSYTTDGSKEYYAVGVIFESDKNALRRAVAADKAPKSNIASKSDAYSAILAESITAFSTNGNYVIDLDVDNTLQLSAALLPSGVSIKLLDWYIIDDEGTAKVNSNGLVTAYKSGGITVGATTRDGSALSTSVQITICGVGSGIEDVIIDSESSGDDSDEIVAVSLNGVTIYRGNSVNFFNEIFPHLNKGIYIIKSHTGAVKIAR